MAITIGIIHVELISEDDPRAKELTHIMPNTESSIGLHVQITLDNLANEQGLEKPKIASVVRK